MNNMVPFMAYDCIDNPWNRLSNGALHRRRLDTQLHSGPDRIAHTSTLVHIQVMIQQAGRERLEQVLEKIDPIYNELTSKSRGRRVGGTRFRVFHMAALM